MFRVVAASAKALGSEDSGVFGKPTMASETEVVSTEARTGAKARKQCPEDFGFE